jgi:hypothetical protein
MVEHFIRIDITAIPGFHCFTRFLQLSGVRQVPDLAITLFDGISHLDQTSNWSRDISLQINKRSGMVQSHDLLIQHSGILISQLTSHFLALPNLTGILTLTNRTWKSMRLRVTMRGFLSREIPSFHGSLITLTFGNCLNIYELTNSKVRGTQHESYG